MIPGGVNELLLRSAAAGGATAGRSVRFNSADSAYLSRTPASAGNRKTWTWSGWVKRSELSGNHAVFSEWNSSLVEGVAGQFLSGDKFRVYDYATASADWSVDTAGALRDVSAWYHIVVAVDTTQATASNRVKIYINGTESAVSSATYPTQNSDTRFNRAQATSIGRGGAANAYYFPGYLALVHFIDGQQLTPSSFGETSATTGQWIAKTYSGSYGTNGFFLDFLDNSTAAALGYDAAGSNDWTVNNLSVTAGSGNDSLRDHPTSAGTSTGLGGEVSGNYCTLNPLDKGSNQSLSDGNLSLTATSTAYKSTRGTIGVSSGKWYWEQTITTLNTSDAPVGIGNASASLDSFVGGSSGSYGISNNNLKWTGGSSSSYTTGYVQGDVIGVAFDADNWTLTFYKNGSTLGTAFSSITAGTYFPMASAYATTSVSTLNFGQRAWAYACPAGFSPLVDTLLPTPTIAKPNTVMDVVTYLGNGTSQSITGLGFSPDFVWIKRRSTTDNHRLFDTVRGATKQLYTDVTDAEGTNAQTLSSFDSTGFSLGDNQGVNAGTNNSYVAWTWDAGSSNATNTSGSVTSTVRANLSAGFSVAAFTSASSGTYTWGHGLGVTPSFIILKDRDSAGTNWSVFHSSAITATNQYILLNSTGAVTTFTGSWGSALPNSSVVSNTSNVLVAAGNRAVAYCWAPVAGYSAFGSYTGNGSSDGPFVYTGFRPRWLMIKSSSTGGAGYNWVIVDTARDTYNLTEKKLYANLDLDEVVGSNNQLDILSSGFKLKSTNTATNSSSVTYVYACFAESPLAYARAR